MSKLQSVNYHPGSCRDARAWHGTATKTAVDAALELFGSGAAAAAAWCAIEARNDHRESDYRFWLGVFMQLRSSPQRPCNPT